MRTTLSNKLTVWILYNDANASDCVRMKKGSDIIRKIKAIIIIAVCYIYINPFSFV